MSASSTQTLITDGITTYGTAALAILGAVLVLGIGYLVFKFGWRKLITDKSLMIGGYYLRNTPYKGYNRLRSQKWNMEHTM